MTNVRFAEWILAHASSKERAAEIVGDLLEQQKTLPAFWHSVFRIVFAMQWRWLIAVPAAMFAALLEIMPYSAVIVTRELATNVQRAQATRTYGVQAMSLPLTVGAYVAVTGMCLWTVAALAVLRYGFRGQVSRLAAMLAAVFTFGSCLMWQPYAIFYVPIALASILGVALLHAPSRRSLMCVALAGVAFWGCFLAFAWVMSKLLVVAVSTRNTTLLDRAALSMYAACILAEAWVLARTRRWLLPTD